MVKDTQNIFIIHGKTTAAESFQTALQVCGLSTCTDKRLHQQCFPKNLGKFFRKRTLQNTCEYLP